MFAYQRRKSPVTPGNNVDFPDVGAGLCQLQSDRAPVPTALAGHGSSMTPFTSAQRGVERHQMSRIDQSFIVRRLGEHLGAAVVA